MLDYSSSLQSNPYGGFNNFQDPSFQFASLGSNPWAPEVNPEPHAEPHGEHSLWDDIVHHVTNVTAGEVLAKFGETALEKYGVELGHVLPGGLAALSTVGASYAVNGQVTPGNVFGAGGSWFGTLVGGLPGAIVGGVGGELVGDRVIAPLAAADANYTMQVQAACGCAVDTSNIEALKNGVWFPMFEQTGAGGTGN